MLLDGWVTMYVSEKDGKLVGCLIKWLHRLLTEIQSPRNMILQNGGPQLAELAITRLS